MPEYERVPFEVFHISSPGQAARSNAGFFIPMKNKKSFILYTDLIHTVEKMPDDKAGELFKTILQYVNDLDPEPTDLIIALTFEPVKQQLKRDLTDWRETIEKRREAGRSGGKQSGITRSKTKQPEANEASASILKQPEANEAVNGTVNDTVSDTDIKERESTHAEPEKIILQNFKVTPLITKNILEMSQLHAFWGGVAKPKQTPEEVRKNLAEFLKEKQILEKPYKDIADLKGHITSWFKTYNFNNTNNTNGTNTTKNRTEQHRDIAASIKAKLTNGAMDKEQ